MEHSVLRTNQNTVPAPNATIGNHTTAAAFNAASPLEHNWSTIPAYVSILHGSRAPHLTKMATDPIL